MTAIGTSLITYPFSFPRAPTFPMLRADAAIDAIWLVLTARSGQLPITLHLRSGRTFDGLAMYPCLAFNGLRRTREGSRDYLMPITCNFPYSALACFRMGMSGSASFQSVRKSL